MEQSCELMSKNWVQPLMAASMPILKHKICMRYQLQGVNWTLA